jgi:hypothetical protein
LHTKEEKLNNLWKEFIDLLEITEESDSGNKFRPNYIGSCRALDGQRMNQIIKEAKELIVSTPSEITFNRSSREVLRITSDGYIVAGEGLSKEEATQETVKLLMAAFEKEIQEMVDARIAADREKVRVLRDAMTRLQGYCEWVIPPHDRICAIARAALAATEASQ